MMASTTVIADTIPTQEAGLATPEPAQPLTLGIRQVALVGFVIVTMLALVTSISYSAGRIVKSNIPQSPVAVHVVRAAPAALPRQVNAAPAPATQQTVHPPALSRTPAPGSLFFQVAAVDQGMAEVSVEFLLRKGFAARMAPSRTEGIFRVLVGPLSDGAETSRVKGQLEAAGFHPFAQRY
ncbi:MAG: SPOR domain-containing protein [Acidobacteriia bacterium]|nr:SPOR domain-containing protein [Terriglobia bacterium]